MRSANPHRAPTAQRAAAPGRARAGHSGDAVTGSILVDGENRHDYAVARPDYDSVEGAARDWIPAPNPVGAERLPVNPPPRAVSEQSGKRPDHIDRLVIVIAAGSAVSHRRGQKPDQDIRCHSLFDFAEPGHEVCHTGRHAFRGAGGSPALQSARGLFQEREHVLRYRLSIAYADPHEHLAVPQRPRKALEQGMNASQSFCDSRVLVIHGSKDGTTPHMARLTSKSPAAARLPILGRHATCEPGPLATDHSGCALKVVPLVVRLCHPLGA